MPIPIDYPHDILPAPLVGKQRSVQQKYDTRDNFDGKMLPRKKRNSSTVYFNVSFSSSSSVFPLVSTMYFLKKKKLMNVKTAKKAKTYPIPRLSGNDF